MFDESTRFDAAEALSVLAHDYGLYRINTRLDEIRFSPRPSLERETLEETGEEFYRQWEPMARETDPYESPDWAETILSEIEASADREAV